jgi:hypothetical protein
MMLRQAPSNCNAAKNGWGTNWKWKSSGFWRSAPFKGGNESFQLLISIFAEKAGELNAHTHAGVARGHASGNQNFQGIEFEAKYNIRARGNGGKRIDVAATQRDVVDISPIARFGIALTDFDANIVGVPWKLPAFVLIACHEYIFA